MELMNDEKNEGNEVTNRKSKSTLGLANRPVEQCVP